MENSNNLFSSYRQMYDSVFEVKEVARFAARVLEAKVPELRSGG